MTHPYDPNCARPLCGPCWRLCLALSIDVKTDGPEPLPEWDARRPIPGAYRWSDDEPCARCGTGRRTM